MAEVVNLRQARKRKARADRERQAEENRARFGRTGSERNRDAVERAKASARLDAHRRERRDDED